MRLLPLLLLTPALLLAGDWSRFRGPNGAGVAEEAPLPDRLGPDVNVVWKTDLPMGKSSPALTKERIFLTAHQDEKLFTLGLDRATGKILWQQQSPSRRLEKMHQLNDEASSSPVTDGSNVYVFFGGYGLLSYTADGKERWRRPMGPFTNFHGMGASPLYRDGKILMICDQDLGAYVTALDAATGETLWRTERPDMVHSFSTPALYEPEEGPAELIVPGSYQMISYAVDDGRELWRYRGLTYQVKSMPVIADGTLYFNSWAPGGEPAERLILPPFEEAVALLDKDGDGELSKEEVPKEWQPGNWEMQDLDKNGTFNAKDWQYYSQRRTSTNSTFALKLGGRGDITETHARWISQRNMPDVPGVLLYQGVLYLIKNGGILTTLNPEDGSLLWQGRVREALDNYYASPVAGDDKVYLASEKGLVTVLKPGPQPEPLAISDFGEAIFATPALADGRVYLRTSSKLYCFE